MRARAESEFSQESAPSLSQRNLIEHEDGGYVAMPSASSTTRAADMEDDSQDLPLKAFNTNAPPGWRPGDADYSLRQNQQLL